MWVFILLLLIGFAIIGVRVFRNGAIEESAGLAEDTAAISSATPPPAVAVPATQPTAKATAESASRTDAEAAPAAPYPPPAVEHPGGPCPSCGSDTVPGAKFCGECGTRLVS